ncbi:MAG: carboxypeptidase regulatory-like domain-containing protein [Thermoguttaceae bacterium]|nr:carboxypeptidase regulatory-like domain-containing protein [Thermoguttaceae bacterium]
MKFYRIAAPLLCVLAACGACKKIEKPEGVPDLHPVEIKLVQDGAPLVEASVSLYSEDPALSQFGASGVTDASGVAKIFTLARYEGVPEGSYAVVVSKNETVYADGGTADSGEVGVDRPSTTMSVVSIDQTNKETTPHRVDVKKGKNKFELDCGSKVQDEATL